MAKGLAPKELLGDTSYGCDLNVMAAAQIRRLAGFSNRW
jgi:hypothetical protein